MGQTTIKYKSLNRFVLGLIPQKAIIYILTLLTNELEPLLSGSATKLNCGIIDYIHNVYIY